MNSSKCNYVMFQLQFDNKQELVIQDESINPCYGFYPSGEISDLIKHGLLGQI